MPLYRTQIFKSINAGKEWSNVYHVQATDLDEAISFSAAIVGAEVSIHKANVDFLRYRVSTEAPGDNVYATTPINLSGARTITGGQYPLFNTVRVDFAVTGGRPSYKYLRLPIEETQTENGVIGAFLLADIQAEYIDLLTPNFAGPLVPNGIVDESGNFFTNVTVFPRIQERQLRRKKKAKASGGLSGS